MHHESKLVVVLHVVNGSTEAETHKVGNKRRDLPSSVNHALDARVSKSIFANESHLAFTFACDLQLSSKAESVADASQELRFS